MNKIEKIQLIKSLDFFEAGVIYFKIKKFNDKLIARELSISVATMYNYQRSGLDKLGIQNVKGKEKKRWPEFIKDFEDVFEKLIPDEATLKAWPMDGYKQESTAPEPPDGASTSPEPTDSESEETRTPPESPTDTSSKPKDENSEGTGSTNPPSGPKWLPAFMACSVLGIIAIIILILAILLIREFRPANQIPPTRVSPPDTLVSIAPTNTFKPTETLAPSITPFPSITPVATLLPTYTTLPTNTLFPTETSTPKPYLDELERIKINNGFSLMLWDNFGANNGPCDIKNPQFIILLELANSSPDQFLLRFYTNGFHAFDDIGNQYKIQGSGFPPSSLTVIQQNYMFNTGSKDNLCINFSGQLPIEAKYLLITVDNLSGFGPFVFKKIIH